MNVINPSVVAPPEPRPSAPVRIGGDAPPLALGIQSQYAYLQLAQSKVSKERAEECIRQVQDSQNTQRKTQMFIAEATRLMEKARKDGRTDVNKELEAFCRQHDIPFNKQDIKTGKVGLWQMLAGGAAALLGVGIFALAGKIIKTNTGVDILRYASGLLNVGVTALKAVRGFLPEQYRATVDSILAVADTLARILEKFLGSPESHPGFNAPAELKKLADACARDPALSPEKLDGLWQWGMSNGCFSAENMRRTAAGMGMDPEALLQGCSEALRVFGATAAPESAGAAGTQVQVEESLARLIYFFASPWYLLQGKSYADGFKEFYRQTTVGHACDAAAWQHNIKQLEAFQASETGKVQNLMVLINNFIGQYNSFLQGAMTAISNANQVMTAVNKGS